MVSASNASQFNMVRQSYMANANQSVVRPGSEKDDKKETEQVVKSPVVVKSAPKDAQTVAKTANETVSQKADVKIEISDAGREALDVAKVSGRNSIVNNNDGIVKRADEDKNTRVQDNEEAVFEPVERRERIMENIELEVEAEADTKEDVKKLVAQQNESSEAHRSEVKAMIEESMAESKERVADAIESAKEASESDNEGPQILSMSGMTASQMQTLYAQGRISFNDYQDKVEARKEELQERIEANNETQRIVVGLDMISRGFDGTEAKDLIAS